MLTATSPGSNRERLKSLCACLCGKVVLTYNSWNIVNSAIKHTPQISGHVQDVDGNVHYLLKGYWDQQYDVAKVIGGEGKNIETHPYQTLWRNQAPE